MHPLGPGRRTRRLAGNALGWDEALQRSTRFSLVYPPAPQEGATQQAPSAWCCQPKSPAFRQEERAGASRLQSASNEADDPHDPTAASNRSAQAVYGTAGERGAGYLAITLHQRRHC